VAHITSYNCSFICFWTNLQISPYLLADQKVCSMETVQVCRVEKELRTAPQALSILHNRLLLEEDIMLLEQNDSVVMLLSMNHLFLKDERHSPKWKKCLLASWEIQPFRPHQLQNTVYYCVALNIKSNPNRLHYQMGNFVESEIKKNCTESGGDGLVCSFPNDESQLLKF
jgi:hypothetical protein